MAPRDNRPSLDFVDSPSVAPTHFYSQGVSSSGAGRVVHTSGQLGCTKEGVFPDSLEEQAQLAAQNLIEVLRASGAQLRDVVKLKVYIVNWDESLAPRLSGALSSLLSNGSETFRPLTTMIPVPALVSPQAKFEIEAIAHVGSLQRPWHAEDVGVSYPVQPTQVDVVVVGGGFSGCMAAYDVHQAGHSVALLEAGQRIGGRSRTHKLESGPGVVELGATWINKHTQPTVYELTKRFGLETLEQYTDGATLLELGDGTVLPVTGLVPDDEQIQNALGLFAQAVEAHDIRNFDFPDEDDITVEEWIKRNGFAENPLISGVFASLTTAWVGREPRDCGLHYMLNYVKSAGGMESINSEGEWGAQSLKIKTGTSSITWALAGSLPAGSVQVNAPVNSITQHGDHALVVTSSGATYKARRVILAIPTQTYTDIRFSPPLPASKRAVVTRTKPGVYAKVLVTYSSAWWREAGLVGQFISQKGPICFSWETTDADLEQYSIAFFVAGDRAAEWHQLGELQREEAILEHFARIVGPELADKALNPVEVNYVEWTKEEFIGGAPTSAMGPGLLRKYGAQLRDPFKFCHFAGGELAFEWKGYLEGALTSGQRAATEVITALGAKASHGSSHAVAIN